MNTNLDTDPEDGQTSHVHTSSAKATAKAIGRNKEVLKLDEISNKIQESEKCYYLKYNRTPSKDDPIEYGQLMKDYPTFVNYYVNSV